MYIYIYNFGRISCTEAVVRTNLSLTPTPLPPVVCIYSLILEVWISQLKDFIRLFEVGRN